MLAACSSTGASRTFTPQSAESNEAIIYFYRPFSMANAMYTPDLHINGESKLSMKNREVSRLILPVGETAIDIAPDEHYSEVNRLTLNLIAGATYFIRVDTTLKIENTPEYEPFFRGFSLVSVANDIAISEITECCTNNKKTNYAPESPSATMKTDGSFSVDKTQNPFSH
jgi:hypothetical protein